MVLLGKGRTGVVDEVAFSLTHACGTPGSVRSSRNSRSRWTLCPWRRSAVQAEEPCARCGRATGGQRADQEADRGGERSAVRLESDPGGARCGNINLEGETERKSEFKM